MFGEKIKRLRENSDLKIKEMASLFGVNETTYGKWEKEHRTPDIYTVKKLANHFNVSIDFLLDNDNSLFHEAMEINKAMSNVDAQTRKRMVDTLKSAFPNAFNEYEWALNVLKANNLAVYTQLKEGVSELSETDIINMAKAIEGGK
ncbi:helix-turn-helix domain-containing protein [Amedibacillus sp. YH-ame6]